MLLEVSPPDRLRRPLSGWRPQPRPPRDAIVMQRETTLGSLHESLGIRRP